MENHNSDQLITSNRIPTRTTWTSMDCLLSQANITMQIPTMHTEMQCTTLNEFSGTMEPFLNSSDRQIQFGVPLGANKISDISECYSPESVNSNHSNENDSDSGALINDTSFFHGTTKPTINYTDNLAPMPNSQDFLSVNLAEEIENICATQFVSVDTNKCQAFVEEENNKMEPAIIIERKPFVLRDFLVNGNLCEINIAQMMKMENVISIPNDEDEETKNSMIMSKTNEIHENSAIIVKNEEPQKSILVPERTLARKVLAPLRMVSPTHISSDTLSTPQIVNDVFEMVQDLDQKEQHFDLITYIDQNENKSKKMYDSKPTQPIFKLEAIQGAYPTPNASPNNKRSRQNSIDSIESTSTSNIDVKLNLCDAFVDNVQTRTPRPSRKSRSTIKRTGSPTQSIESKRQRGRPRRTEPVPIPNNLSPDDRKNIVARIKNNEASRRSRLTRREKELAVEQELVRLEIENERLRQKDALLDKSIAEWRQRTLKLGLLA